MVVQVPTDAAALANALEDTKAIGLEGARTHLRNAAGAATSGKWADSIRDSIHAVEPVAKILEPTADTLGPAAKKLSDKIGVHQSFARRLSQAVRVHQQ